MAIDILSHNGLRNITGLFLFLGILPLALFSGCKNTKTWRTEADSRADELLSSTQKDELGHDDAIQVESAEDTLRRRLLLDQNLPAPNPASLGIRDLPDTDRWQKEQHLKQGSPYTPEYDTTQRIDISLIDAIRIAAGNNRDFQTQKETLFQTALRLDLEENEFRSTFRGMLQGEVATTKPGNDRSSGSSAGTTFGITRKFRNGIELASSLSLDLAKMLSSSHGSSFGLRYDGSISIPLLRGSGEFVVAEPLTQAQRNLVYQVREFEQYKRDFVVRIASSYLGVLRTAQMLKNQEENYKRIVTSTRRSRRMADAGLMPEYQFDQTIQNELGARVNWVSAQQTLEASLEAFRVLLGLPPEAKVFPKQNELDILVASNAKLNEGIIVADYTGNVPSADAPVDLVMPDRSHSGPNEIDTIKALNLAFEHRPDLRNMKERIEDAQRAVLVAEDSLRAELTIGGNASFGESRGVYSGDMPDGTFRPNHGSYSALLNLNLPIERTAERNTYRNSLIALEKCVRNYQALEDTIKQDVYGKLRDLLEHRESVIIQLQAVKLAERRVKSTDLLLQAGRAELRDLLESQSALLAAQNSLYASVVSYRVNELEFQRTLGVLEVTGDGVWKELDLTQFK
ncbi:MAG: TolC family protein [Victivallales bacterium]|nr:TolC family protein [Victivallales bacterium]